MSVLTALVFLVSYMDSGERCLEKGAGVDQIDQIAPCSYSLGVVSPDVEVSWSENQGGKDAPKTSFAFPRRFVSCHLTR